MFMNGKPIYLCEQEASCPPYDAACLNSDSFPRKYMWRMRDMCWAVGSKAKQESWKHAEVKWKTTSPREEIIPDPSPVFFNSYHGCYWSQYGHVHGKLFFEEHLLHVGDPEWWKAPWQSPIQPHDLTPCGNSFYCPRTIINCFKRDLLPECRSQITIQKDLAWFVSWQDYQRPSSKGEWTQADPATPNSPSCVPPPMEIKDPVQVCGLEIKAEKEDRKRKASDHETIALVCEWFQKKRTRRQLNQQQDEEAAARLMTLMAKSATDACPY